MISFPIETQQTVYWTSVTSCFVLLATLCCCNGVLRQETVKIEDPLRSAPEPSTMPETTKQQETVVVDLGTLLDAGDGAVVTLVAGETRLAVHRAVLAAGSPVLAAMFHNKTLEAHSSEFDVPGVEGPVLRQLVAFLYTGRAPQIPSMALHLLVAAEKYSVSSLRDSIEPQVAEKLSVENAVATAVLALKYSRHSLSQAAIAFIRDHLEMLDTLEWAEAVRSHPGEVVQITQLLTEPPAKTSASAKADRMATSIATRAEASTTITVTANATTATPTDADSMPTTTATPAGATAPTTAARPHSDHTRTAASASLLTARHHTLSPDAAADSLWLAPATADSMPTPIATRAEASNDTTAAATAATATPADADSMPTTTAIPARPATPTEAARTHNDHGWTAVTAPLLTAGHNTLSPDAAAVSLLLSLPTEEKSRKLIQAAREGSVQELRALLAAGADVGASDEEGWTPLHWAADYGHLEVTRSLLQAGAEVDARDRMQRTPLHWAAGRGRTVMVRLLLAASADPNARDGNEWSPLHWAAVNGRAQTVAMLLRAGADMGATTNKGRTALDLARQICSQVVQMLQ